MNRRIFALYLLLSLGLTYPLPFRLTAAVPNDIGDPLLNTWILAWDAHALLTGPLHLFEANIFYPLPNTLAYSEHMLSTALLALPFQFIEPLLAYNLSLLASFPLAAFGMYLLALRWTGRRGAAFIAGLIFAFGPYRLAAIAHLQLLSFQWLPFVVLMLELSLRRFRFRWQAALLIFLLLQILASWYLALYTGLIVGLYLLGRAISPARLMRAAPAFVIAGLVVLPFTLPYLALVDELRQARPLSLALSMAAHPADFMAAAPFNRIFGPPTESLRQRPGFTEENSLFVGLTAPLLAGLAWLFWLRRACRSSLPPSVPPARGEANPTPREANPTPKRGGTTQQKTPDASRGGGTIFGGDSSPILALSLILGISLLLTLPGPYAALARLLPGGSIVRVPARWLIPATFGLAGLAAPGYAGLKRRRFLLPLIAGLLLLESLSIPLPLAPVENHRTLNPAYHWLAARPAEPVLLELPIHTDPEYPEVKRQYASTLGWWRLVNGYSGYTPPRQPRLARRMAGFPDQTALTALQALAAIDSQPLLVLVHPGEAPLDRTHWETTARWQAERSPVLQPLGQFAGDYLYRVRTEPVAGPPLATFGPIELLATDLSESALTLYWRAAAPPETDYTLFIHLRAPDGFVRSQADGPPVSGHYPTTAWPPDQVIQDIHPLPPTDFDHLAVGLYDPITGHRLPAFDSAGRSLPENALIIPRNY